jgi:hypothetical protein
MALLTSQHAFSKLFSAGAQNPLHPCVFSPARNSSAPRNCKKAHFAFQTCTTKNDTIFGPKRAKLVGMVGFSTTPNLRPLCFEIYAKKWSLRSFDGLR